MSGSGHGARPVGARRGADDVRQGRRAAMSLHASPIPVTASGLHPRSLGRPSLYATTTTTAALFGRRRPTGAGAGVGPSGPAPSARQVAPPVSYGTPGCEPARDTPPRLSPPDRGPASPGRHRRRPPTVRDRTAAAPTGFPGRRPTEPRATAAHTGPRPDASASRRHGLSIAPAGRPPRGHRSEPQSACGRSAPLRLPFRNLRSRLRASWGRDDAAGRASPVPGFAGTTRRGGARARGAGGWTIVVIGGRRGGG